MGATHLLCLELELTSILYSEKASVEEPFIDLLCHNN